MTKTLFNHHLYPKFILTPLCTAWFWMGEKGDIKVKCVYIFGIRVARLTH